MSILGKKSTFIREASAIAATTGFLRTSAGRNAVMVRHTARIPSNSTSSDSTATVYGRRSASCTSDIIGRFPP